ncbi:MAG: NAD(P)/FAD-dependent oxidoreductase [Bacteroidota bacterium]
MQTFDVIVVGGGPAGLMAAGRAAESGCKALLLEKMEREGRKLLITGKGRCNITNDAPLADFITHVYPDGRFLRHAFSQFFSGDIIELLRTHGVETTLERGGRYFPTSNKSADVLNALLTWVHRSGVEIRCHHRVEKLVIENQAVKGVKVNGALIEAKHVILATGGKSYPATGSTGDGYELARQAGHAVVAVRPSLVPLETAGYVARELQGLSLKNVKAVVWVNGKKTGEEFGEMLFTHFGLSGPIILTISRLVVDELKKESKVEITIDLKPALDEQKLDKRLLRDLDEQGKKKIGNIFANWLPSKMIPVFMDILQIDPDKEGHQVSAMERKSIRKLMKNLPFTVSGNRSFREAIITAGGIPTSEISSRTMESKLVQGLFFAGELIDLDGETGGYNLQIACSTGWLAGDSCKV